MRPATVGPSSRPPPIPGVARDRSSIPRATPGAGCSQIRLTRHRGICYSTRLLDNTRGAAKSFHWQHGRRSSLASGSNSIGHHGAPGQSTHCYYRDRRRGRGRGKAGESQPSKHRRRASLASGRVRLSTPDRSDRRMPAGGPRRRRCACLAIGARLASRWLAIRQPEEMEVAVLNTPQRWRHAAGEEVVP